MKSGDTFPVTVQGITVAQAVVEAVEHDRVTILIPGTRAVVGIRTTLADDTTAPEKETIIDGVHRPSDVEESTAPVEAPVVEAPAAAPVETVAPVTPEAPVEQTTTTE